MNSIKLVTLLCLVMGAVVGCTANLKPTARSIQRDTAPSGASISEFLDLIRIDDLVYLFVEEEKGVLEAKLSEARAKSHRWAKRKSVTSILGKPLAYWMTN